MDNDKRCGTCKHFIPFKRPFEGDGGHCGILLGPTMPFAATQLIGSGEECVQVNVGTDCPCWEPK